MSYRTNQTWFYYLNGRDLQIYELSAYGALDTLGGYKIRLPGDATGSSLIYPNEDIASGLRIEYTSIDDPFVAEALEDTTASSSGIDIEFSTTTITGAGTGDGFADLDRVRIIGSSSNDGDYTAVSGAGSNTLVFAADTFTAETAGERITVYQIPKEDASPSETSHVNLNRMLSIACVDYIKAMMFDRAGDIERKEYYLKEFWNKVGDNESNKRKTTMAFPNSPFAVR